MKGSFLLNDTALLNIKNTRKRRLLLMQDILIYEGNTTTSIVFACKLWKRVIAKIFVGSLEWFSQCIKFMHM